MERFADPEMIQGLSNSELLQGSLITTLMGMGTTFVVLILLWGIIAFVSNLINKSERKAAPTSTAAPAAATVPAPAQTVSAPTANAQAETGTELIAVIAAAIAAMEGTSPSNLIVRKISRISGNSTSWSRAGASEIIDSRKF